MSACATFTATMVLICLQLNNGKLLWQGNFNNGWESIWNLDKNGDYGENHRESVSDPFGYFKQDVLKVTYPSNSYGSSGGTGFKARPLGNTFKSNTLCIEYYVAFDTNFDWVLGGKLPGLFGDDGKDSEIEACSGGQEPNGTNCFTTRMMWRPMGEGEVYAYILEPYVGSKDCTSSSTKYPNNGEIECCIYCNSDYGESIGRGMFYMNRMNKYDINYNNIYNGYNKITQQITMNNINPTQVNGKVDIWYNNEYKISFDRIEYRINDILEANGIQFETFFGGGSSSWATPIETYSYFANFSLYDTCNDRNELTNYLCDYNCFDHGKCIGNQKCQCNDNNISGDLCNCKYCNKYNILFEIIVNECWVDGWILDFNITNNGENNIKSIDFSVDFPYNVSLQSENSGLNFKQINRTTYQATFTRTINNGQSYQFEAMQTHPQLNPFVIVNNVEY
eukprot:262614_1